MPFTFYTATAPFARMLGNIDTWLDKAMAHAETKKFDSANYLAMRFYPDMLPLSSQIQIATDTSKGAIARLAGVDNPKYEDNETTLAQLRERVSKTVAFIKSVPADKFAGAESRDIELPRGKAEPLRFKGDVYLTHFALPNFFFHVTTTYALLRHAGVELGKADYLGPQS